jgi:hypothetical protein
VSEPQPTDPKRPDWTAADVMAEIYGDLKWPSYYDWETEIVNALMGKVDFETVMRVVRAAHEAEQEGARNAGYD